MSASIERCSDPEGVRNFLFGFNDVGLWAVAPVITYGIGFVTRRLWSIEVA